MIASTTPRSLYLPPGKAVRSRAPPRNGRRRVSSLVVHDVTKMGVSVGILMKGVLIDQQVVGQDQWLLSAEFSLVSGGPR
jgi:hypothetical protein